MQAQPGNRIVQGDSGVVFEVPESVASGLVGNKTVVYVDDEAGEQKSRSRSGKGRQTKAEKQAAEKLEADEDELGAGDEDDEAGGSTPDDGSDSQAAGEDRDPAAAARRARRTRGRPSASE